jgi:hypothetical protein
MKIIDPRNYFQFTFPGKTVKVQQITNEKQNPG